MIHINLKLYLNYLLVEGVIMSSKDFKEEIDELGGALFVPRKPWRWEYYIFVYLAGLTIFTYYIISEMMKYQWDPNVSLWGMPLQIAYAVLVSIIWSVTAIIVTPIYYYAMKREINKALGRNTSGRR
jgi:hypothetical protein